MRVHKTILLLWFNACDSISNFLQSLASIWIIMERDSSSVYPVLREVYCYGYRYHTNTQIIFYDQQSPNYFYWTDPLRLDPSRKVYDVANNTELEETLRQVIKPPANNIIFVVPLIIFSCPLGS